MWNQLESLNAIWNVFCIIVGFICFDFTLLLFHFCYFISFIDFFSCQNKMLDQFCNNDSIMQVLLINNNKVTQLS
jgi:hypothetical protein